MLRGLNIRNMLLIETLDLEFQPGLNVLTGETGAGKSILLDSLGFVLGWRGQADMVRQGAGQGEVTAWFDLGLGHPAHDILQEVGLPDSDELLLRRINTPDGRKTAYVNDRRCTGEVLRHLSDCLIELHGQHDDRGLLNIAGHRMLLDAFAEIEVKEIKALWQNLIDIEKELQIAQSTLAEEMRDAEYIRHAVDELKTLDPKAGEEESLDTKRRLIRAGERIQEDIQKAGAALGSAGAEGLLSDAMRWLQGVEAQAEHKLAAPIEALSRAINEVAEAEHGIQDCLSHLICDPHELERVEERLFAIRALARKHNVKADDLPGMAKVLQAKLEALETGEDHIDVLKTRLQDTQARYDALADKLTELRCHAGCLLDEKMQAELQPLRMEAAVFKTNIQPTDPGPAGKDKVAFTVSTNPGTPSGPIHKIASGGELSRFLLALKVCLTARADGLTLIFDEIDRGIGGATADAVGRRLSALSGHGQVLVVTHSPQVAACGDHQWRVSKMAEGQTTWTSVQKLDAEERIDEIARMLAGDVITEEARAAAEALLQ